MSLMIAKRTSPSHKKGLLKRITLLLLGSVSLTFMILGALAYMVEHEIGSARVRWAFNYAAHH